MKKFRDYDDFNQRIPKSKKFDDFESIRAFNPLYVTQAEFVEMQKSLESQLKEQTTVLEQLLLELKQMKLHLASLSGETIEPKDAEE